MAAGRLLLGVVTITLLVVICPSGTKALFENCTDNSTCTQDNTFCNGSQCVCQESTHYTFNNTDCYQYCPELTNLTNGMVSADNRTFEATATYTCNNGYVINGTNNVQLNATCESNGTWTPGSASCVKRDCGIPNGLDNGNFSAPDTTFEATGTYTCNPGYIVSGKNTTTLTVTCTENGTWSEATPTCIKRECGTPVSTSNSNFDAPNTTFEATGTYTCDPGYIVGDTNTTTFNVTCTENGTWSDPPPACIKRDCGSPNNTNNGNVSAPNTTFEATGMYTCDTGYIVSGTNTTTLNVTCTENGTWSEAPPFCTKRDCSSPSNINKGIISGPETTFEATGTYTCDTGYIVSGENTTTLNVTCTGNGTWSEAPPTCIKRDCGSPNNINNANVSAPDTTFEATGTYMCETGYIFSGTNTTTLNVTCTENGTWSEAPPTCIKRDCGSPNSINNGSVSAPDTTFEATGNYTCDTGYIVSGTNTTTLEVTCTENGTWSEAPPTCIKRDCDLPNNINNGSVSAPDTTFEATGTYTCDTGYIVSGKNTTTLNVTCTENGTWSEAPPTCIKRDCGSLENITDGAVAAPVTTYEATANYTCNDGYVISGTNSTVLTVACASNGSWSQASPTCERRDCGSPNNTNNGNVSAPDTTFEATGTYSCDTGYIVSGKNTTTFNVTCTENGTWSEAPPTCIKRDCGSLASITDGTVAAPVTTFEATANFTCNSGYVMNGTNSTVLTITCASNGSWSQASPTCERRDCGSPNNTNNGNVSAPDTTFEATGTYSCDTGYIVSGKNTTTLNVTCTENGTWSEAPPTCIKRDCGSPNSTNNGNVSAPDTKFEATGIYTCDTGYIVSGKNTTTLNVTCTENGTWSEGPPTCIKRDCGSLANITDGTVAAPVTTFEATANFTCNDGYVINGTNSTVLTITCASNGSWSQASPTCERRDCGPLYNISNGTVAVTATTFEAIATYTCDTGYLINNTDINALNVTCQANGNWSESPPICVKRDCGTLSDNPNGMVNVEDTEFEGTATYTCNTGYIISGTDNETLTVTCTADGNWSAGPPTCVKKDCGTLSNNPNGTVSFDDTKFEGTATYTCNTGYVIRNTTNETLIVTCTADGSWSDDPPICVKKDCGEPPALGNGSVARTSTTFEAIANYTCNTGYIITDTDSATLMVECTAEGNWNTIPTCTIKAHELGETCPDPVTADLQPGQLCTGTNALCLVSTGSEFTCQCDSMFYDDNGDEEGGTCKSVAELQVTDVTFSSVITTSMVVTWTPPNEKEAFVNGYQVEWMGKSNSSQTGSSKILLSNIVQFSISSNVNSGRAYKVKIITWNRVSYSSIQKSTSVEKEQALKPQRPGPIISESSNLDAEDKSIDVTWTANGYASRYETALLEGSATLTSTLFITNFAVIFSTDIRNGHRYNVSITAFSEEFEGSIVEMSETFTEEIKTVVKEPSPPSSVECKMTTDTTVTIQWMAPGMPNGDLVEYIVDTYLLDEDQPVKTDHTNSTALMFEITGLMPGSYYVFNVSAVNEQFTSVPSKLGKEFCATRANVSEIPNNFSIPTIESRSFDVTWTRPSETYGENFGYVLQVRTSQDKCVMELIRNCTDCTQTFDRTTLQNMCNASLSIVQGVSKTDIESDTVQSYTVNGSSILPDTSYKVSVSAINAVGRGIVASTTIRTEEEAPQKPSNVQISNLTATSCNVTWDIGEPRPGNTTFEIIISATTPVEMNPIVLIGFDKRIQALSGLEEYWNYTVTVKATTSVGSMVSDPTEFTTLPAAPGPVDGLDTETNPDGNYTQILVKWKLPALLQRNGEIVRFVLQHNISSSMNTARVERETNSDHLYEVRLGVEPEVTYQFIVYAVNRENQTGVKNTTTITTPAGTPINDFEVAQNKKVIETESVIPAQTTIQVSIATGFFEKNVYGNIVLTGLIGCAAVKCGDAIGDSISLADYNSYQNWHRASKDDYTPYRITRPGWRNSQPSQNTRKRRNTESTEEFTVGSQVCNDTNSNEYCNGPLRPSTSYIIHVVVCTNGGCLISNKYGPYITLSEPDDGDDKTVTIILAVILSVVVVTLIVVGVIYFLKKRRSQPRMSKMPEELNTLEDPPSPNIQKKRPVKLNQFESHLASLHKDSNLQFSADYEDLKAVSPSYPQDAANLEENRLKNRYINILPFDHSRVKLFSNGDEDSSDYINANYLPGYGSPREYIGCQGPIPGTIDDFWRMVWEQNVSIIVMLTLCKEGQKVKCEQYWPDETGEPKQYGDVVVEVTSNSPIQTYVIRMFKITNGNKSRTVKHFHFLSWLDFQANVRHDIILDFITHVRSHVQPPDTDGPMIIHCSAGVGRTGTYICLDHLMQYIEKHGFDDSVDIFDMVLKLRENRPLMVQTEQQYVFIHDCVKELMDRKRRRHMDNIYENQGFSADENIYQNTEPTLYENVQMKTEL